ncbi:MAG: hypothetical protein AAFX93_18120 [Verrucomicrobiota bacterium]
MELDNGNCVIVRLRGKEAYVKDVSLRTGTRYQADGVDELAQHSEVLSSTPEVNHEVVHRNNRGGLVDKRWRLRYAVKAATSLHQWSGMDT